MSRFDVIDRVLDGVAACWLVHALSQVRLKTVDKLLMKVMEAAQTVDQGQWPFHFFHSDSQSENTLVQAWKKYQGEMLYPSLKS